MDTLQHLEIGLTLATAKRFSRHDEPHAQVVDSENPSDIRYDAYDLRLAAIDVLHCTGMPVNPTHEYQFAVASLALSAAEIVPDHNSILKKRKKRAERLNRLLKLGPGPDIDPKE